MDLDVLGLGVSTLDILALVEHFPLGDDVQPAAQISLQGGGPVATALVTLARLGARTAMLDTLGGDWRGDLIRAEFEQAGVSTAHIRTQAGASSPSASIWVRQADGERAIAFSPGSVPPYPPEALPLDLIRQVRFLHLNGRHLPTCMRAAQVARSAGVLVSFDGGAHRYRSELDDLLPLCDIFILNAQFACACRALDDPAAAATDLLAGGARLVVITDGLRGSWIYASGETPFHQPAFPFPRSLDTTGCGDAYHGAFLFGLVREYSLADCAALASAVAALNSQHLGGRGGLPTLAEARAFLARRSPAAE